MRESVGADPCVRPKWYRGNVRSTAFRRKFVIQRIACYKLPPEGRTTNFSHNLCNVCGIFSHRGKSRF
jgi:hypothetical protein